MHQFKVSLPKNGFLLTALADAALGEGGEGGKDDFTPKTVRRKPGRAGRNQMRFRIGNCEG